MKVEKLFLIGALVAYLGIGALGCENSNKAKEQKQPYIPAQSTTQTYPKIYINNVQTKKEEFRILYPSEPRIIGLGYSTDSHYAYGLPYTIEFVKVSNMNGKKTLIYPSANPIEPGNVDITYWPIKDGKINSDELVKIVESSDYVTTMPIITLHADGMIVPDSIVYK